MDTCMEQIEQKVQQKSHKSEKSYGLGRDHTQVGYNNLELREVRKLPQLFICGFDKNVTQLFSDPSVPSLPYKEQTKACFDLLQHFSCQMMGI